MSTALITATPTLPAVSYEITDEQIEATRQKYAALEATTPAGYEEVRQAIAFVRGTRTSIEKRRVELKADALAFGRLVDSEAKRWTSLIESIEQPLLAKKQAVDDEKARIKAEAEAAKLREIEARLQAERAQEEARLAAEREAEAARMAEERARLDAERAALDEQRRQLDAAQAAQRAAEEERAAAARETERQHREAEEARLRQEREALDRERRELAAQREEAARAEAARQAEADALARAEADRVAKAEREAYIANLQPDVKKLAAFAEAVRALPRPTLKSAAAKRVLAVANGKLDEIAAALVDAEKAF